MLDAKRFAYSGGILWGAVMFVMTLLSVNNGYGTQWLTMMADMYPGYDISMQGSFIGLVYGFIDGFVLVGLFCWIHNKIGKYLK